MAFSGGGRLAPQAGQLPQGAGDRGQADVVHRGARPALGVHDVAIRARWRTSTRRGPIGGVQVGVRRRAQQVLLERERRAAQRPGEAHFARSGGEAADPPRRAQRLERVGSERIERQSCGARGWRRRPGGGRLWTRVWCEIEEQQRKLDGGLAVHERVVNLEDQARATVLEPWHELHLPQRTRAVERLGQGGVGELPEAGERQCRAGVARAR